MNELQLLADRLAQALERIGVLEAVQIDSTLVGEATVLTASMIVPANRSLVLESLEVPDGITFEIASGGSLVLVG